MIAYMQEVLKEKELASTEKTLIRVLIKNLGKEYPDRGHATVHASDVTKPDFCPRMIRLLDVTKAKPKDRYLNTALKATFDLGTILADRLVEDWMGDCAHGFWVCVACGSDTQFGIKPNKCGCGKAAFKHKEVKFFSESHHISGSLDLIANLDGQALKAVELKTIKADEFDKLVAPLAEHKLRTRLYLKLIEDSINPIRFRMNTQSAKVLYVSKGFGKMHAEYGQILPFKEFDVQRDDESIQIYLDKGTVVKESRANNTIPTEKICDSIACSKAKYCQMKAQCWSGEYP